jgi:hypothetical protein
MPVDPCIEVLRRHEWEQLTDGPDYRDWEWRDPENGVRYTTGEAYRIQDFRDARKQGFY